MVAVLIVSVSFFFCYVVHVVFPSNGFECFCCCIVLFFKHFLKPYIELSPNCFTVSKYTWCLTSTETMRLIRDGENGGEGDYIPIATLSPPE